MFWPEREPFLKPQQCLAEVGSPSLALFERFQREARLVPDAPETLMRVWILFRSLYMDFEAQLTLIFHVSSG